MCGKRRGHRGTPSSFRRVGWLREDKRGAVSFKRLRAHIQLSGLRHERYINPLVRAKKRAEGKEQEKKENKRGELVEV